MVANRRGATPLAPVFEGEFSTGVAPRAAGGNGVPPLARNRRGMMLVEVVITMVIVGVAFFYLLTLHGDAMRTAMTINNLRVARLLAQRLMGEIEAEGYKGEDEVPSGESGDWGYLGEEMGHPEWSNYRYEVAYESIIIAPERTPEEMQQLEEDAAAGVNADGGTPQVSRLLKVTLTVTYPKDDRNEGEFTMTTFLIEYDRESDTQPAATTPATTPAPAPTAPATGGG